MIRGIGVDVSAVSRWEDEDARAHLLRAAFSEEEAAWVRKRSKLLGRVTRAVRKAARAAIPASW